MDNWQIIALVLFITVLIWILKPIKNKYCKNCKTETLKLIQFYRAYPAPIYFYSCTNCNMKLRKVGQEWDELTEEEWEQKINLTEQRDGE